LFEADDTSDIVYGVVDSHKVCFIRTEQALLAAALTDWKWVDRHRPRNPPKGSMQVTNSLILMSSVCKGNGLVPQLQIEIRLIAALPGGGWLSDKIPAAKTGMLIAKSCLPACLPACPGGGGGWVRHLKKWFLPEGNFNP
jgi:hypothetical protein